MSFLIVGTFSWTQFQRLYSDGRCAIEWERNNGYYKVFLKLITKTRKSNINFSLNNHGSSFSNVCYTHTVNVKYFV